MKVKEVIKKINDCKLFIEIKDQKSGGSYGFFTKNDFVYNDKFKNETIKNINVQYFNGKRVLVVEV